MTRIAITSIDNPYNPFTDFDRWLNFDLRKGKLSCCSVLANVSIDSNDLDSEAEAIADEMAINDIVAYHPAGIYLKVQKTPTGFECISPYEMVHETNLDDYDDEAVSK